MNGEHEAGKGSVRRPQDMKKWDAGHDAINWPSKGKKGKGDSRKVVKKGKR